MCRQFSRRFSVVGAVEPAAQQLGLGDIFVGVFVVAVLGNAAEHTTAIDAALKNRMDLSLSIAIGSSVQIALFVAPVLVLASLFLGPTPMDLAFSPGLVLMVLLSILITGQVASDGRSDWLKGTQLLAVYLILGLTYFSCRDKRVEMTSNPLTGFWTNATDMCRRRILGNRPRRENQYHQLQD